MKAFMDRKMPPPYRGGATCRGSTLLTVAPNVPAKLTDVWTDRRLYLRLRVPAGTTEDALTGVPVETDCLADAWRCTRGFGPRLKGALQKHLPGNACTRRRSLSLGSTPPTSLSSPVNVIRIWLIAYAVAWPESTVITQVTQITAQAPSQWYHAVSRMRTGRDRHLV